MSGLQGRALSALGKPEDEARPGFLQRLFGSREDDPQGEPIPEPVAVPAAEAPPQVVQPPLEAPQPDDMDALQPLPALVPEASAAVEPEPELQGPALIETAETPAAQQPLQENVSEPDATASEPVAAAQSTPTLEETFGEDGPYALPYAVEPPTARLPPTSSRP